MDNYSTAVALFDFIPVLLAGTALALLARGVSARHPGLAPLAWTGAALVVSGGLAKASWKLVVALKGLNIEWLQTLLFVAMAPGFVAMAFSVEQARRLWHPVAAGPAPISPRARMGLVAALALPLLVAAALAASRPESRAWFFWLLAVTTLANAAMIVAGARLSLAAGLRWPVAAGFAANFAGTLVLSGLSRLPPTEQNAWIQEGVNLFTQLALLLACAFLSRRLIETVPRETQ